MAQKKYQKLQGKNMYCAKAIYAALKENLFLSEKKFGEVYLKAQEEYLEKKYRGNSLVDLTRTVKRFMQAHGLMTWSYTDQGFKIYGATKKLIRTKNFKTATKEVQLVTNHNIDRAIDYVRMNNNTIPLDMEAPIVANYLELEGDHWKYFVEAYEMIGEVITGSSHLEIKYKVIGPVQEMHHSRMIEKDF